MENNPYQTTAPDSPKFIWTRWKCTFTSVLPWNKTRDKNETLFGRLYLFNENPGDYEIKVNYQGHLIRSLKFAIGYDSAGDYGYINANNTGVTAKNLVLQPNGSQGNVGIGTTVPDNKLTIVQSTPSNFAGNLSTSGNPTGQSFGLVVSAGTNANDISFQARNQAGTSMFIVRGDNGVGIGTTAPDQRLSVSGNASKSTGGTTWAVFSDERLKNIRGRFTPGLKALLQLEPIRFQYKPDNTLNLPSGNEEVGFSAQAVAKVLPEAVSPSRDGFLQLHSDPILWTMLNAIKEQQAQIEKQQSQIATLRTANAVLSSRLRGVETTLKRRTRSAGRHRQV